MQAMKIATAYLRYVKVKCRLRHPTTEHFSQLSSKGVSVEMVRWVRVGITTLSKLSHPTNLQQAFPSNGSCASFSSPLECLVVNNQVSSGFWRMQKCIFLSPSLSLSHALAWKIMNELRYTLIGACKGMPRNADAHFHFGFM